MIVRNYKIGTNRGEVMNIVITVIKMVGGLVLLIYGMDYGS